MKKKYLLPLFSVFVVGVLYAQNPVDTTQVIPVKEFPLDTFSVIPLQPEGYKENPKNMGEKLRNLFLSQRFKLATFQRDSFYNAFHKLTKQYGDLRNAYRKDTAYRTNKYNRLWDYYTQLNRDYDTCQNAKKALKSQYADLVNDYKEYRNASLSEQDKLKMNLAENNRELARREARLKDLERTLAKQDSLNNALRDMVKKALLGFDENALSVTLKNGRVYVSFSEKFLFQSGSADVNNPQALEALKMLADVINQNQKLDILIEGHTDSIPIKTLKYADNWDLSAARAIAIVRLLSDEYAVNPVRLTAAGRSQYNPKASNATLEGRAQNRRTEIILIPNLEALFNTFR